MPMLISDDPRARNFAKREFRRGWVYGWFSASIVTILITCIIMWKG